MIWLTLLKDNWKTVLVGLLLVIIVALHLDVKLKEQQIGHLNETITSQSLQISNDKAAITELNGQIKAIHDATAAQIAQAQTAETQRMAIVASIASQVKGIQSAPIPKDCPNAIDWAIQHRGDLTWPKQ
jgi:sensor domain CHASE-containing protein